jgi:ribosomal protein S12 methylthiotransferase accessory factor
MSEAALAEAGAPAKFRLDGAQRSCSPAETLARIAPFFAELGITRVADITGLDRIGIPVALCIRPDSATLAVDSGKGATIEAALASAAMEGIERVTVERARFQVTRSTARLYGREVEWNFPLLSGAVFDPAAERDWVTTEDLFSGKEILVPRRVVALDCLGEEPMAESAHYATSNGLASGNTREEAVASALYEVIERDAVAIATMRPGAGAVIDHSKVPWPSVQALAAKIKAAGCGLTTFDCTAPDIAVPTVMAVIFDRSERGVGVFRGYGAHLSPEVAMSRAVCEAAQARAVIVAGARDDITQERYANYQEVSDSEDLSRWDQKPNAELSAADASSPSFREDIALLMERLEAAGFTRALLYDFDAPERTGAHVVRILIPGLEGYFSPVMAHGPRIRAAMEEVNRNDRNEEEKRREEMLA